jgi:hypothetical protein
VAKGNTMKRTTLACFAVGTCLLVPLVVADGASSSAGEGSFERSAVLRRIAATEAPSCVFEQPSGFTSQESRRDAINRSIGNARPIVPFLKRLADDGQQVSYTVHSATTNLFVRRATSNAVVVAAVPLLAGEEQSVPGTTAVVWAQPRPGRDGSGPAAWQIPSGVPETKAWLAELLTQVIGSEVEVVLVDRNGDRPTVAVCRVHSERSDTAYAKAYVFPEGVEVTVGMPSHSVAAPSPRGRDSMPMEKSPLVFPPGMAPHQSR